MKLPVNGRDAMQSARTRVLEMADRQNHKRGRDVEIGEGRLILADATTGARYEVFIDDGAFLARQVGEVDANITILARLA